MSISIFAVIFLLLGHFVADFLCQTDYMAQNKSRSNSVLLLHTITYTTIMFCFTVFLLEFNVVSLFLFALITFVAHTVTDYFTSRVNSRLWAEKKVHWFFVSIGFDQLLHTSQLILTYYLLTN